MLGPGFSRLYLCCFELIHKIEIPHVLMQTATSMQSVLRGSRG